MPIAKSELKIQTAILRKLRTSGGLWFKIHDIITKALPDIIGCYQGLFIAIEVKRVGERPTKLQDWVLEQVEKAGGIGIWIDDVKDLDTLLWAKVKQKIKEMKS